MQGTVLEPLRRIDHDRIRVERLRRATEHLADTVRRRHAQHEALATDGGGEVARDRDRCRQPVAGQILHILARGIDRARLIGAAAVEADAVARVAEQHGETGAIAPGTDHRDVFAAHVSDTVSRSIAGGAAVGRRVPRCTFSCARLPRSPVRYAGVATSAWLARTTRLRPARLAA